MNLTKFQSISGLVVGITASVLTVVWFGWKLMLLFFLFGYAAKADNIAWVKQNYGE